MQELYRSDLLRSLGWAITDSIWQMSVLWLIYQVLIAIPFRRKPHVKHVAALGLLCVGSLAFIFSFINRFSEEKKSLGYVAGTAEDISVSITNIFNSTLPYFSSAYLVILAFLLARLIYNFTTTQRLKSDLKPAIDWQHYVNTLAVKMRISKDVFIYISEHISIPSTIGYFKPIILLPLATLNQLSVEQLEAVIIHEMAHIRRNDYLVNLLVAFIETVLFFNPFAHLLARAIRKECELCCDDEVVLQQDPEAYVQALLLLERSKLKPVMAMAVTGKHGMLLGRVKRILNVPDEKVKYRHKLTALVLLAGLIMLIAILAPSKVSEQDREKTNVVASQVIPGEPATVPLPFIMKIPPAPNTPPKNSIVVKEKRNETASLPGVKPKNIEEEFEFTFIPDAPAPPTRPSDPPNPGIPPEEFIRYFDHQVLAPGEELAKLSEAPDPRDRRNPDILRRSKVKVAQPGLVDPELYRGLMEHGLNKKWIEEAEKFEESMTRSKEINEQLLRINDQSELIGKMITTSPVRVKKKAPQTNIIDVVPGTAVKPIIKTVPGEGGMTITIIQHDEQIEIRVNDGN